MYDGFEVIELFVLIATGRTHLILLTRGATKSYLCHLQVSSHSASDGQPPRIGLLVSSRRLRFTTSRYHAGQGLRVRSHHIWGDSTGMASFDCSIHDEESDELLAEGRLNCFLPEDESELEMTLKAGERS